MPIVAVGISRLRAMLLTAGRLKRRRKYLSTKFFSYFPGMGSLPRILAVFRSG